MDKEEDPLESVPMSQILKSLERRFDCYVLSTIHTEEDEDGVEGEIFDCAMLGSKTVALGMVERASLYIRKDIEIETFGYWEEEEEAEEDDPEGEEWREPPSDN